MPQRYRDRDGRTRSFYRLPMWAKRVIEDLEQERADLRSELDALRSEAHDADGVPLYARDEEDE